MNNDQVQELRSEVTARSVHLDSFQKDTIEEAIYCYYYFNCGLDYNDESQRGLVRDLDRDTRLKYRKLVADVNWKSASKKTKRRVQQHSNILNAVSLAATLAAVLIKPDVLLANSHGQKVLFTQDELNIPAHLMFNIDETSILLDPGENVQALTTADAVEMLKELNLSVSISTGKNDGEETLKKRSLQLFAITSADGCVRGIIIQIYDRCCTKVRVWEVSPLFML